MVAKPGTFSSRTAAGFASRTRRSAVGEEISLIVLARVVFPRGRTGALHATGQEIDAAIVLARPQLTHVTLDDIPTRAVEAVACRRPPRSISHAAVWCHPAIPMPRAWPPAPGADLEGGERSVDVSTYEDGVCPYPIGNGYLFCTSLAVAWVAPHFLGLTHIFPDSANALNSPRGSVDHRDRPLQLPWLPSPDSAGYGGGRGARGGA